MLFRSPYGSAVLVLAKGPRTSRPPSSAAPLPALDLSTGWRVTFRETKATEQMETLRSWTNGENSRFYSGVAVYSKEVNVPAGYVSGRLRLDFGEGKPIAKTPGMGYQALLEAPVREAAVVYVNARRAGAVWCPPYSVDVTRMLRPGRNLISIEVGNLAVNYMAGHPLPDYRALTERYGERFQAQDLDKIKPVPAGLLGPVRRSEERRVGKECRL